MSTKSANTSTLMEQLRAIKENVKEFRQVLKSYTASSIIQTDKLHFTQTKSPEVHKENGSSHNGDEDLSSISISSDSQKIEAKKSPKAEKPPQKVKSIYDTDSSDNENEDRQNYNRRKGAKNDDSSSDEIVIRREKNRKETTPKRRSTASNSSSASKRQSKPSPIDQEKERKKREIRKALQLARRYERSKRRKEGGNQQLSDIDSSSFLSQNFDKQSKASSKASKSNNLELSDSDNVHEERRRRNRYDDDEIELDRASNKSHSSYHSRSHASTSSKAQKKQPQNIDENENENKNSKPSYPRGMEKYRVRSFVDEESSEGNNPLTFVTKVLKNLDISSDSDASIPFVPPKVDEEDEPVFPKSPKFDDSGDIILDDSDSENSSTNKLDIHVSSNEDIDDFNIDEDLDGGDVDDLDNDDDSKKAKKTGKKGADKLDQDLILSDDFNIDDLDPDINIDNDGIPSDISDIDDLIKDSDDEKKKSDKSKDKSNDDNIDINLSDGSDIQSTDKITIDLNTEEFKIADDVASKNSKNEIEKEEVSPSELKEEEPPVAEEINIDDEDDEEMAKITNEELDSLPGNDSDPLHHDISGDEEAVPDSPPSHDVREEEDETSDIKISDDDDDIDELVNTNE